jgi:predicted Fe-Mo cluster-binding NifX family protein
MKIVISSSIDSLDGPFDPRFGRAAYFCIVEMDSREWEAFPNPAINATGGAGVQASQLVVGKGIQVAISGDFGPNAYMTLSAADVQMFLAPASEALTCRQLLGLYQEGKLKEVTAPTRAGHQGKRR